MPGTGFLLALAAATVLGCTPRSEAPHVDDVSSAEVGEAELVIVGASLAGLSAAIEAARAGIDVVVIDMNSVFGGHGIQTGGVAIVGTPMQQQMGFEDSPDKAYADWLDWTGDPNLEWMRYYVENSREEIYDFLIPLGVVFDRVNASHGNSIPRFHMTRRRGLNLVRPLFLEALRYRNLRFRWNLEAIDLLLQGERVTGVVARDMRSGRVSRIAADAVVLATGGFQRNAEMVRENWPADRPVPERMLTGSGKYSLGTGHRMASAAGAALTHLDRQYNSYSGIPDPRDPTGTLGLGAGNPYSVWLNLDGRRFVNPLDYDKDVHAAVVAQPGGTYWAVFDHESRNDFRTSSADWADRPAMADRVLEDPSLVKRAGTLEALADLIGLPAEAFADALQQHNALVASGRNDAFGPSRGSERELEARAVATPPFYAVRFYLTAHKNMGGISIDLSARALDGGGRPVPGLYAAGEVTGSAGINGKAGLDGTFTGPSILIGRVAGRSAAQDIVAGTGARAVVAPTDELTGLDANADSPAAILNANDLAELLRRPRDGYWHFERVHESVLERRYACAQCHSPATPMRAIEDRAGWRAQSEACDNCHLGPPP